MARTVALIAPVCPVLLRVSCSSETVPNGPKREEMHQNMCLGSNDVDQECSLWKILKRHHSMNFCIYCISLSRFASSFMEYRNGSKCTQKGRNAPKPEFRVEWCWSGAFVAKNSKKTSRHELLHLLHQFVPFCFEFVEYRNGSKCTEKGRNTPKHEFRV